MVDPNRSPDPGFPLVVSGPSGVGKTVLCRALVTRLQDAVLSVSATTRPRREGEEDGESYFFHSEQSFGKEREAGRIAEWAEVHGHLYGTPRPWLDAELARGRIVILNLDVQGGRNIRAAYAEAALVFVMPPSLEVLERRLRGRKTDRPDEIERRLERARGEMELAHTYDYVVVNDELERAVDALVSIAREERARVGDRRAARQR